MRGNSYDIKAFPLDDNSRPSLDPANTSDSIDAAEAVPVQDVFDDGRFEQELLNRLECSPIWLASVSRSRGNNRWVWEVSPQSSGQLFPRAKGPSSLRTGCGFRVKRSTWTGPARRYSCRRRSDLDPEQSD